MPEADKDLTGLLGLGRIKDRVPFTRDEIRSLIELTDPNKVQQLFEAARQVREQVFGNRIFLYGFLYFSTHCRNNCRFCQYRKSNNTIARYRKTKHQILEVAREMKNAGVHLIDLTMGEDPAFYNSGNKGFHEFIDMVKAVQNETGSPIMVSPGSLPDKALKRLAEMGIDWYACYQETHNPDLFKTLRTGQAYTKRLEKKYLAIASCTHDKCFPMK